MEHVDEAVLILIDWTLLWISFNFDRLNALMKQL